MNKNNKSITIETNFYWKFKSAKSKHNFQCANPTQQENKQNQETKEKKKNFLKIKN
jgi:hypothetical protein